MSSYKRMARKNLLKKKKKIKFHRNRPEWALFVTFLMVFSAFVLCSILFSVFLIFQSIVVSCMRTEFSLAYYIKTHVFHIEFVNDVTIQCHTPVFFCFVSFWICALFCVVHCICITYIILYAPSWASNAKIKTFQIIINAVIQHIHLSTTYSTACWMWILC